MIASWWSAILTNSDLFRNLLLSVYSVNMKIALILSCDILVSTEARGKSANVVVVVGRHVSGLQMLA